jgi:hypothetical protein
MRATGIFVALVSTCLLPACGSGGDPSAGSLEVSDNSLRSNGGAINDESIRSALSDARARWAEAEIDTYRLEVAEEVNYWSAGRVWVTAVADGAVTEVSVDPASTGPQCSEIEWTVEQLHDLIERDADEIEQFSDPSFGIHTFDVMFNEVGVPVAIDFDLANGADEETALRLTFTT